MPTYLITRSDFDTYHLRLGANIDFDNDMKPLILEAQFHDLRKHLTPDFYTEVLEVEASGVDAVSGNLTKVNYDLLKPYIVPVLVYYARARYIQAANYRDVRYGQVVKKNPYSEPVESKDLDRQAIHLRSMAFEHYQVLKDFLDDNISNYATYRDSTEDPETGSLSVRIHTLND